jgi:hypothetical protein
MISSFRLIVVATLLVATVQAGIPIPLNTIPYSIGAANFKDPYSGPANDALIDINIEAACVSNLEVIVQLPNINSPIVPDITTGYLTGPSFSKTFVGTSEHSSSPVSATLTYDSVADTLTFTNFDVAATLSLGGGVFNLNFDIPDTTLVNTFPNFVLLALPNFTPSPLSPIIININDPNLFLAVGLPQPCGDSTISGDPQFAGFQGQTFQFHGLPDEHFNLISSPSMQLNSHFVYLANGECSYNDTVCWTHPGTYVDQLGWSFGSTQIRAVAGPHMTGMTVFINEQRLTKGHYQFNTVDGEVQVRAIGNSKVSIASKSFSFEVANADYFFNLGVSVFDRDMLHAGSKKHTITDSATCAQQNTQGVLEAALLKKYHVTYPVHGLIGQTWRNVDVCGKKWIGSVQDYIVSNLFAQDYVFNFYNSTSQ